MNKITLLDTSPATDALRALKLELDEALAEAESALDTARTMSLDTPESEAVAKELAEECTALIKAREEQRKTATGPLNTLVKQVNDAFRPLTDTLKEVKRTANTRLFDASLKAKQEREEALKKIEAAGPAVAETVVMPAQRKPVELPKGVGREVIVVEIEDATKVPRGFCSPDVGIIKAEAQAARKRGHMLTVPGVRIYLRGSGT